MSKIVLSGHILVPDDDLDPVMHELVTHIDLTRREAGCLVFEVTRDPGNPNRFNVYEEFVSRDAFEAHQQRVRESRWAAVTRDVERHYQVKDADA